MNLDALNKWLTLLANFGVIGGLVLSTVLTLLIVPAGFSLADGFEKRVGPWLRTRFLTYRPGDNHTDRPASGLGGPEAAPAE